MSTELRKKIGYWFFFAIGIIGISLQLYHMLYTFELEPTYAQGFITVVLGAFVFRPNWLSEIWKYVLSLINKKTK